MSDQEERWAAVASAIKARMSELRMIQAELVRRSGISVGTLIGYLDGAPIKRQDKAWALCQALGWTPDSIDQLLRGEPAETLEAYLSSMRAARNAARDRITVTRVQLAELEPGSPEHRATEEAIRAAEFDARRYEGEIQATVVRMRGAGTYDEAELDRLERGVLHEERSGQGSDVLAGLNGKLEQATPEELSMLEAYLDGLFARRER